MLFDVQAALAEILGPEASQPADCPPRISRNSGNSSPETRADVAPKPPARAAVLPFTPQPSAFPHGTCRMTGGPRTWTGKVVSLDEWQRLSDWEREGPAGRLFCGICREWVAEGGACREPGCWKGDEG